jgi:hypothetical protein
MYVRMNLDKLLLIDDSFFKHSSLARTFFFFSSPSLDYVILEV